MVLRPIPAESPQLREVSRKRLIFKDMFVKLMHSFSLTREMIRKNGVLQSLSLATITSGGTVSRHTNMSFESHHGSQRLLLK